MTERPSHDVKLSAYHGRMMRGYRKVIEAAGIDPDLVYRAEVADPYAVPHIIRSMIDQVVRGEVIQTHALIDWYLDRELARHFWGRSRTKWPSNRSKRAKTLEATLRDMNFSRKLRLVQSFRMLPREILKAIESITSIRNGVAHNFLFEKLPLSKRKYKGKSIRTAEGLLAFEQDATLVRDFFMPSLRDFNLFDDSPNQSSTR